MTTSLSLRLIDDRNIFYWETVKGSYNAQVELYDGHYFRTRMAGSSVRIDVPVENVCKNLFTHELLHLWLRKKKILITDYLVEQLRREPLLKWSLTENLMEQVGHLLEHVHILPIYLREGFELTKFTEDFDTPACNQMHIRRLFRGMQKTAPAPAILDLYIHHFFAMKANPDPEADYSSWLADLENINEQLFTILNNFWMDWVSFDIETYDPTENTYKTFTADFIHKLGAWTVKNLYSKEKVA